MISPSFTTLKQGDANPLGMWQWAKLHVQELNRWAGQVVTGMSPTGARMAWHADVAPPTGWLAEDGALMEVANYPALYNVIGHTYGGTGTMFQLPRSATPTIIRY